MTFWSSVHCCSSGPIVSLLGVGKVFGVVSSAQRTLSLSLCSFFTQMCLFLVDSKVVSWALYRRARNSCSCFSVASGAPDSAYLFPSCVCPERLPLSALVLQTAQPVVSPTKLFLVRPRTCTRASLPVARKACVVTPRRSALRVRGRLGHIHASVLRVRSR